MTAMANTLQRLPLHLSSGLKSPGIEWVSKDIACSDFSDAFFTFNVSGCVGGVAGVLLRVFDARYDKNGNVTYTQTHIASMRKDGSHVFQSRVVGLYARIQLEYETSVTVQADIDFQ